MKHTVTLFRGGGIGPEVSEAVIRVVEATGVEIAWEPQSSGPAKNLPGIPSRFDDVDVVIVRENTEGS